MAPLSGLLRVREQSLTYLDNFKPEHTQIGYNLVSLLCLVAITYMATIRIRQYRKARIVYPARVLASATYMTVMVYILVLNMLSTGAGLHSLQTCRAAIYACLVFYGTVKGLLLCFMAERVRTVRSMNISRKQDKLWMSCIVVISIGLCGVTVGALCRANYDYGETGICKVGIPDGQTVIVFLFDALANFWLTGAFIWLLRPILQEHAELQGASQISSLVCRLLGIKSHGDSTIERDPTSQLRSSSFYSASDAVATSQTTNNTFHEESKEPKEQMTVQESIVAEDATQRADSGIQSVLAATPSTLPGSDRQPEMLKDDNDIHILVEPLGPGSVQDDPLSWTQTLTSTAEQVSTIRRLDTLVKKSIVGTLLLFAPCIANAILYWYFKGYEPAWLCMTACSVDVTTALGVLHWLTKNGEDDA